MILLLPLPDADTSKYESKAGESPSQLRSPRWSEKGEWAQRRIANRR